MSDCSVPTMSDYSSSSSDSWERPGAKYITFILWDMDREFARAGEAYDQWLRRNRKPARSNRLSCFALPKSLDDPLARALSLGQQVHSQVEHGIERYGNKFERADSTCHSILEAQLLRIQHEVCTPLFDCGLSRTPTDLPYREVMTAARAIRRTTIYALHDLFDRLQAPLLPILPPPRLSVGFCPFALQLQKVRRDQDTSFFTRKVRPHDKYDEREECPHCEAQISVSQHSGLPDYRRILFQSHIASSHHAADRSSARPSRYASFACTSCYKTFEDSYGLLDHVFHKEIGSERSCQRRWSSSSMSDWMRSPSTPYDNVCFELNPVVVEKCLRNCLRRELSRAKELTPFLSSRTTKELEGFSPLRPRQLSRAKELDLGYYPSLRSQFAS